MKRITVFGFAVIHAALLLLLDQIASENFLGYGLLLRGLVMVMLAADVVVAYEALRGLWRAEVRA
jgi:uncharacterized membrane protein YcjF (UPF0283 family)